MPVLATRAPCACSAPSELSQNPLTMQIRLVTWLALIGCSFPANLTSQSEVLTRKANHCLNQSGCCWHLPLPVWILVLGSQHEVFEGRSSIAKFSSGERAKRPSQDPSGQIGCTASCVWKAPELKWMQDGSPSPDWLHTVLNDTQKGYRSYNFFFVKIPDGTSSNALLSMLLQEIWHRNPICHLDLASQKILSIWINWYWNCILHSGPGHRICLSV